jgi:hypothetical protein
MRPLQRLEFNENCCNAIAIPKTQTFPDDNPTIQKMESGDRWKVAEFVSLQTD